MATIQNIDGVITLTSDDGAVLDTNPIVSETIGREGVEAILENDWSVYNDDWIAEIRKYGKVVTVQGLFRNGNSGTVMMTLPDGFRPSIQLLTTQRTQEGNQRVDIYPDGRVICSSAGERTSAGEWLSVMSTFITD